MPRSKRLDASEGSLWRRAVRKIVTGSQCAASMKMLVVSRDSSVVSPPITPASPIGPESSVMSRSSAESVAVDPVEGGQPLARSGAAYDDRAGELVAVEAVDRLTELEHHVVGDVDGQRDRPHAGQLDPAGHPVRESARPGRSRSPTGP